MVSFKAKKHIRIGAVIAKVASTILALWVGGLVITKVAVAANGSSGPFLQGFKLIGMSTVSNTNWTLETSVNPYLCGADSPAMVSECLNGKINSTGILSVVGIVGMASIVMEFVDIRLK